MDPQDFNPNLTPADKISLCKYLDGDMCCEGWKYWLIAGMIFYLGGSTRLNMSYAMH